MDKSGRHNGVLDCLNGLNVPFSICTVLVNES